MADPRLGFEADRQPTAGLAPGTDWWCATREEVSVRGRTGQPARPAGFGWPRRLFQTRLVREGSAKGNQLGLLGGRERGRISASSNPTGGRPSQRLRSRGRAGPGVSDRWSGEGQVAITGGNGLDRRPGCLGRPTTVRAFHADLGFAPELRFRPAYHVAARGPVRNVEPGISATSSASSRRKNPGCALRSTAVIERVRMGSPGRGHVKGGRREGATSDPCSRSTTSAGAVFVLENVNVSWLGPAILAPQRDVSRGVVELSNEDWSGGGTTYQGSARTVYFRTRGWQPLHLDLGRRSSETASLRPGPARQGAGFRPGARRGSAARRRASGGVAEYAVSRATACASAHGRTAADVIALWLYGGQHDRPVFTAPALVFASNPQYEHRTRRHLAVNPPLQRGRNNPGTRSFYLGTKAGFGPSSPGLPGPPPPTQPANSSQNGLTASSLVGATGVPLCSVGLRPGKKTLGSPPRMLLSPRKAPPARPLPLAAQWLSQRAAMAAFAPSARLEPRIFPGGGGPVFRFGGRRLHA